MGYVSRDFIAFWAHFAGTTILSVYGVFYVFSCYMSIVYMLWAAKFPQKKRTYFWAYTININFDLEFWWLSIVSLTRLWNGVSPHGWTEPGFVIANFGLLFHPRKIFFFVSEPQNIVVADCLTVYRVLRLVQVVARRFFIWWKANRLVVELFRIFLERSYWYFYCT